MRNACSIDLNLRRSNGFGFWFSIGEQSCLAAVDAADEAKGETGQGYVADGELRMLWKRQISISKVLA